MITEAKFYATMLVSSLSLAVLYSMFTTLPVARSRSTARSPSPGSTPEAELNSKIVASALCSQLSISIMLGSISLAPYLSRSPGLVVLGNVPFGFHQEVWIIEARLNAKTLASALAFSALHGCLRH